MLSFASSGVSLGGPCIEDRNCFFAFVRNNHESVKGRLRVIDAFLHKVLHFSILGGLLCRHILFAVVEIYKIELTQIWFRTSGSLCSPEPALKEINLETIQYFVMGLSV